MTTDYFVLFPIYIYVFSLFYIDKYIQSVIVNYYYTIFLVIHY